MIFDSWQELQFGNSNIAEMHDLFAAAHNSHNSHASNLDSSASQAAPVSSHRVTGPSLLSDTTDNSPIIIIGSALVGTSAGAGGGGAGGGGRNLQPRQRGDGGGSDSGVPDAKDTPCVETTFATPGATTTAANNAALAASNAIAALNDENYEYSSMIYYKDGVISFTSPWTNNLVDQVNWVGGYLTSVPAGAVIVGVVHNHPDDPVMNDTIPSGSGSLNGDDWRRYDELVNWNANHDAAHDFQNGITVDTNLLLYIYSNEDQQTHVYDNTDKNQTSTSCSL